MEQMKITGIPIRRKKKMHFQRNRSRSPNEGEDHARKRLRKVEKIMLRKGCAETRTVQRTKITILKERKRSDGLRKKTGYRGRLRQSSRRASGSVANSRISNQPKNWLWIPPPMRERPPPLSDQPLKKRRGKPNRHHPDWREVQRECRLRQTLDASRGWTRARS